MGRGDALAVESAETLFYRMLGSLSIAPGWCSLENSLRAAMLLRWASQHDMAAVVTGPATGFTIFDEFGRPGGSSTPAAVVGVVVEHLS